MVERMTPKGLCIGLVREDMKPIKEEIKPSVEEVIKEAPKVAKPVTKKPNAKAKRK